MSEEEEEETNSDSSWESMRDKVDAVVIDAFDKGEREIKSNPAQTPLNENSAS